MKRIFFASHGHLASGAKSSLEILLGNAEQLEVFDAYIDESNFEDKFKEYLSSINDTDQLILLSDLYGGSVNQIMFKYINRPNTYLIAGINLAILLEIAADTNELSKDRVNEIITSAQSMMVLVEDFEIENHNEDFF